MSERLSDDRWRQELEWLRREPHAAIHQLNAIAIVEELLALRAYELNRDKEVTALRARAAKLEASLENVAKECSTFPIRDGLAFRCESIARAALNKDAPL